MNKSFVKQEQWAWTKRIPEASIAVLLAAFFPVQHFNVSLFLTLNGLHNSWTDKIWLCFTTLGDGLILGIILGLFIFVNPRVTIMGVLLMILSSVVVNVLKAVFPVARPAGLLNSIHVVGPLLKASSFPSGHTAAAFSAGLAIVHFCSSRAIHGIAVGIILLIGFSRIFVGAHFPADILGGMVCSLTVYVLVRDLAWDRIKFFIPEDPFAAPVFFRFALFLELAATFFVLTFYAGRFAEYPLFAAVVASSVLLVILIYCFKHRGPGIL